jgi:glutaminyl-tRNA synthetase
MAHPNINMRDPVMYRIIHEPSHHRTGDKWKIYPMYDWSHGQNDAMEGITHSLCSIEYENHRPLYEWFLEALEVESPPRQIEFSRLVLSYTILSKRYLRQLVDEGLVSGWDDPRMPTLRALRRRGYTKEAIHDFIGRIGVAKANTVVDISLLEACIRDDLNKRAPRRMGVMRPLKLVIENYPEDQVEELEAINNPEDLGEGTRMVPFSKVLYIERDDFQEEPHKKFYRLYPGNEVRLRYAYLVTCTRVVKDPGTGEVTEVHCTYDPATRGGDAPDGRRVRGTIHWVSAEHALPAEIRLYDRLFTVENPDSDSFKGYLNPDSLEVLEAFVEPILKTAKPGYRFQFERQGYFCVDPDTTDDRLIINRTVPLRDSWAKIVKK